MPLSFSSDGSLEAEVIFAGYGFNINSDSLKWNDYNGIDVKGKWVMILRADPEAENTKSPLYSITAATGIRLCLPKTWEQPVYCWFPDLSLILRIVLNSLILKVFQLEYLC